VQNDIKQNYTPSRHDHDGNTAYQLSDPPKSTDMNKERKEEKTMSSINKEFTEQFQRR